MKNLALVLICFACLLTATGVAYGQSGLIAHSCNETHNSPEETQQHADCLQIEGGAAGQECVSTYSVGGNETTLTTRILEDDGNGGGAFASVTCPPGSPAGAGIAIGIGFGGPGGLGSVRGGRGFVQFTGSDGSTFICTCHSNNCR